MRAHHAKVVKKNENYCTCAREAVTLAAKCAIWNNVGAYKEKIKPRRAGVWNALCISFSRTC